MSQDSDTTARAFTESGNSPPKFRLYSVLDILRLPPAEWVIEDIIPKGAQVVLYGPSGEGKSFVAIDWAMKIATGTKWLGREVQQGPVVYVAAEGGEGISKRILAYVYEHSDEDTVPAAEFVLEPVQLRDVADVTLLIDQIKGLKPLVVFLDTFARCFVGGDENTSKDVGVAIEAMRRIHAETGAILVLVHHTGKNKESERGSSALRAAADVMIRASMPNKQHRVVVIENNKQKDEEESENIKVYLQKVSLGRDSRGKPVSSCVVAAANDGTESLTASNIKGAALQALLVLGSFPGGTARSRAWRKNMEARGGKAVSESTFHRYRRQLLEEELIEEIPGEKGQYRVTAKGTATANRLPLDGHDMWPTSTATTATTPVGGGSAAAEGWSEPETESSFLRGMTPEILAEIEEADRRNGFL